MAIKLDDFLSKKKEATPVLDLRNSIAGSKEELRRLLEKVPEFKIRPEKIKPEEIKIREKDFNFRTPKRELKPPKEYQFADPIPLEMRGVRIEDLSSVNIPWKMLTTLRPKNKLEDEFFSRLVELGKLRTQTEEREKKISNTEFVRKMKSRLGVMETRVVSCTECGEEFCMGETCGEFMYEAFIREDPSLLAAAGESGSGEKKSKKRKSRRKTIKHIPGIPKSRSKTKERNQSKSKEKKKTRSRNRNRSKSKSRERKKSKSRERKKSKSRERDKSKSRERKKKSGKKKANTKPPKDTSIDLD